MLKIASLLFATDLDMSNLNQIIIIIEKLCEKPTNNTIKIAHIKSQSFKNKFVNIFNTINNEEIDILAINETFLKKNDKNDSEISISN